MSSHDKGGLSLNRLKGLGLFLLIWPLLLVAIVESVKAVAPYLIVALLIVCLYKFIARRWAW